MGSEFVERMCERYLDDYMQGRYGFNGVIEHAEYLAISRCLRANVKRRRLPLKVLAMRGRVFVYFDDEQLTPEERAKSERANQLLLESVFSDSKPAIE